MSDNSSITLDRTRPFSTRHGEGAGRAHFGQDGFYFDNEGKIILDDEWLLSPEAKASLAEREARGTAKAAADKAYAEAMAKAGFIADKKTEILKNAGVDLEADAGEGGEGGNAPSADDDLDLVLWAKGKLKARPQDVLDAAARQYAIRLPGLPDLVAFMIEEHKIEGKDVKVRIKA